MTNEEAQEYAKTMTYRDAIYNLIQAKSIPYRKATFIKINELLKESEQKTVSISEKTTNGDIVKTMFPNCEIYEHKIKTSSKGEIVVGYDVFLYAYHPVKSGTNFGFGNKVFFDAMWWNAPYKKG